MLSGKGQVHVIKCVTSREFYLEQVDVGEACVLFCLTGHAAHGTANSGWIKRLPTWLIFPAGDKPNQRYFISFIDVSNRSMRPARTSAQEHPHKSIRTRASAQEGTILRH